MEVDSVGHTPEGGGDDAPDDSEGQSQEDGEGDSPAFVEGCQTEEDDEDGDGVEFVDELEDLGKDTTTNLPLKLDSGSYVVFCNIEGHYASGMNAAFSVK